MTASKEQLTALLERVEAASGPDREIDAAIMVALVPYFSRPREYTASIDAAVALVEKVLPGWAWSASVNGRFEGFVSELYDTRVEKPRLDQEHLYGWAKTPALALCAALIRALIAKEEQS